MTRFSYSQLLYLITLCLLTRYTYCEQDSGQDDGDSFSNFLSNLFNGMFDSSSSKKDVGSSVNTTDSMDINSTAPIPQTSNVSELDTLPAITPLTSPENTAVQLDQTVSPDQASPPDQGVPPDQAVIPDTPHKDLTQCQTNPDFSSFCKINENVVNFLRRNTTMEYISQKIFNCDAVKSLVADCKRGEWCLPSTVIYDFMQRSDSFLGGALCSPSFATCLKDVYTYQQGCQKSTELYNMHVALDLLCELGSRPGLTYECFGQVMAMLHINYADSVRPSTIPDDDSNPDECHAQKGQLIKRFICIRDVCTYQTDMLVSFAPWQWFVADVSSYENSCQYSDVCGLENKSNQPTPPLSPTTPSDLAATEDQLEKAADSLTDEDKSDRLDKFPMGGSSSRTKMLIGMLSAVVVATFGFTLLICALWKKMNRHSAKRYNHPSYSKLQNEESQPLYQ